MFRGSPVLSTLLLGLAISGPVILGVRSELMAKEDCLLRSPKVCALAPGNFVTWAITLLILYSVKYVEHIVGTLKILLVAIVSYALDTGVRILAKEKMGRDIDGSGPYAILFCVFCLYSVLLPTVRGRFFGSNEKILMLVLFAIVLLIDGLTVIVSLLSGFVVFVILGPVVCPSAKEKEN